MFIYRNEKNWEIDIKVSPIESYPSVSLLGIDLFCPRYKRWFKDFEDYYPGKERVVKFDMKLKWIDDS